MSMNGDDDRIWETPSRGNFNFITMCEEIKNYIKKEPNCKYHIFVGSDSQRHCIRKKNNPTFYTKFVTAVAIHREGKGGQFYLSSEKNFHINSLQQKIMYESNLTYIFHTYLENELTDVLIEYNVDLTPHIDIGVKGKTKQFITQVLDMFKAIGRNVATIKPNCAGCAIANKYTKQG